MDTLLELPDWYYDETHDLLDLEDDDLLEMPDWFVQSSDKVQFDEWRTPDTYVSEVEELMNEGRNPMTGLHRTCHERFHHYLTQWRYSKDHTIAKLAHQAVMAMRAGYIEISIEDRNYTVTDTTPDGEHVKLLFWDDSIKRVRSKVIENPFLN